MVFLLGQGLRRETTGFNPKKKGGSHRAALGILENGLVMKPGLTTGKSRAGILANPPPSNPDPVCRTKAKADRC